jgi:hypothetical protein
VLTTGEKPGVPDEAGGVRDVVEPDTVTENHVSESSAVHRLSKSELPVLVTSLRGLFRGSGPTGTRVQA